MSSSNTTGNTSDRLNQHNHTPSPTTVFSSQRNESRSHRFHTFMVPVKHVFHQFCKRIGFRAHWMQPSIPQPAPNHPPNHPPYQLKPAIQELAAERIAHHAAQAQAQAAAKEQASLSIRTQSLLNASLKEVSIPYKQTPSALEDLRAMMQWRKASLTQYNTLLNLNTAHTKQQALATWEASYEALRQHCMDNHEGEKIHAMACYQAIHALSVPGPSGHHHNAAVRYAGAFGEPHTCIQAVLSKLYASHSPALPLPPFFTQAMEKGAIASPEALVSYGIDLLFRTIVAPLSS